MSSERVRADIRATALYREAAALYDRLLLPGTGTITDATEVYVSPDDTHAVFAGTLTDTLECGPRTRICEVDLKSGDTRVLTFGPGTDRLPKYSADGRYIAFLSDRQQAGDFQLYLLDLSSGAARPTPRVRGWVEYLHWSPDGKRILLGVAGHGADVAGRQGAVTSEQVGEKLPSWMPAVTGGDENFRWRRVWIYELATDSTRQVPDEKHNIWEAVWCGLNTLAAVTSPGPDEGLWYSARLHAIELESGSSRELYVPQHQIGWPGAAPSGGHLAIVEAICSDRGSVVGDLKLIDCASGEITRVDTGGVNIGCTQWRDERRLLLAGVRGFETVVAQYDATRRLFTETWSSDELSVAGPNITISGCDATGSVVLVGESHVRGPELAVIREGKYRAVRSLNMNDADGEQIIEAAERLSWQAPDGLEIQGWLLRPKGPAPYPLILHPHGGPVSHWRPMWLGRLRPWILLAIKQGYAVFLPNPRGSSGRGQAFARHVLGDMGGADTKDCLSGVDYLVEHGIADPERLGVAGVSYGGYMSAWLITQDSRFAAAVAVAPVTNQVTQHLISNIPHFVSLFLADRYENAGGRYFERSPIMHAHKVKTPTLNICGAVDRCTPAAEAVQFHNALLENGVESVLVTYPQEGHGIRKFPAAIDYAARVVDWFERHMAPVKTSGAVDISTITR